VSAAIDSGPMTTFQWYTLFHLIAAFALAGGSISALAAAVTSRGEIAGPPARVQVWSMYLARAGGLLVIVFGLLLVDEAGYDFGDSWISAALVLWLAVALVAEGVVLRNARSAAPDRSRALYGSAALVVLVLVILILMVWRPGS